MYRQLFSSFWVVLLISGVSALASPAAPGSCDNLAQLALPRTKIALAQPVSAGRFTPPPSPDMPGTPSSYKDLPAFCRVVADAGPTPDSDIKMEVWMPAVGWNGKFQGQGNGGFAGVINYPGMAAAVKRGYATAGTDTGHSGGDATWALGHPEKVIDFGYRGVHEMTVTAKAIIDAFYGHNPRHSYFAACSDGGREALMEAQRFPEDYEGIIAGAPANYWTHLLVGGMWTEEATSVDPASYIPAAKLPALSAAVLTACDAQDGLADGILNDPRQCHFDPEGMLCQGADSNNCLTAPQVAALKKIYAGPHDSAGHQIFSGYMPGGEEGSGGWTLWITGTEPRHNLLFFFGTQYFSRMVYGKADWDYKTFNVDEAVKLADEKTAVALNSIDPNLKPFRSRGGKLIMYHGWSDAAIPAPNSIDYYASVVKTMGQRRTDSFLRLFMVPGMQHCGGGPGPNYFGQDGDDKDDDPEHNVYAAIERWVVTGVAPSRIIATKYANDFKPGEAPKMTRPLCPYPQIAKYKGTGDKNDAANFVCAPGNN